MNVKLIAVTKPMVEGINTADELISYCARVSNPSNQLNVETAPRLMRYCVTHGHWSVFETAGMTVEIVTSRAIAAQILRHRSFTFQEFSQRYAMRLLPA
jgi:thymidylate synthase (FAD)